ncbi:hypothetical protein PPTG_22226 [Phytophthora nicotianae INRA-310]|uniref:Uncharacterized protein n=1 Tax=Phytophthora nicotianae (strain INRA-310) TaxID=761204 RepID=W2QP99_PHYN3|nr:hypothetical protein PPTG_22226 [Phytophthora nicotianae INRA-310]ETN14319.1 hypothetical protein PPTG_22226 [Phytophthora nicotianae INRA-310]
MTSYVVDLAETSDVSEPSQFPPLLEIGTEKRSGRTHVERVEKHVYTRCPTPTR